MQSLCPETELPENQIKGKNTGEATYSPVHFKYKWH